VHQIIDDHRAFEVCHGRRRAVLLTNIVFPISRVKALSVLPRLPQVDAAGHGAIFGQEVVLAEEPFEGGEKRGFQTPGRTLVTVLSRRLNGHLWPRIRWKYRENWLYWDGWREHTGFSAQVSGWREALRALEDGGSSRWRDLRSAALEAKTFRRSLEANSSLASSHAQA
jgi:hypothetical protein